MKNRLIIFICLMFILLVWLPSSNFAQKGTKPAAECKTADFNNPPTDGHRIKIATNDFDGQFQIKSSVKGRDYCYNFESGGSWPLEDGGYDLIIGFNDEDDYIKFDIKNGEITNLKNPAISTPDTRTLSFNTIKVMLDLNEFKGRYCFTHYRQIPEKCKGENVKDKPELRSFNVVKKPVLCALIVLARK